MRRIVLLVVLGLLLTSPVAAQKFQTVPADQATLIQEGPGKLYCPGCGMNLVVFHKTSHALGARQYCSLHCLVEAHEDLAGARVVDTATLELIPAATAHYVVGSDVPGTMTMTSKYAFADREAAAVFSAEHGGTILSFEGAVMLAREDLARENAAIGKKRAAAAQKGQKIFEAMCGDVALPAFGSIAEAKTYLAEKNPCGQLKDAQYQALAIYLVRGQGAVRADKLSAPEDARCPVCGMFPARYPEWLAIIEMPDGRRFHFDGVKDLLKFSFEPHRYHEKLADVGRMRLLVTDHYSLEGLDGREAFYVIGANVFGPMGHELIPFRSREEAQVFSRDHFGKRIVTFDEITRDLVLDLDN